MIRISKHQKETIINHLKQCQAQQTSRQDVKTTRVMSEFELDFKEAAPTCRSPGKPISSTHLWVACTILKKYITAIFMTNSLQREDHVWMKHRLKQTTFPQKIQLKLKQRPD